VADEHITETPRNILSVQPEERFDRISRMAAKLFDVPFVQVNLLDIERKQVWTKSRVGLDARVRPYAGSICEVALREKSTLVVHDASKDPRFVDHHLVTEKPWVRFISAQAIYDNAGNDLGVLTLMDCAPRHLTESQYSILRELAAMLEYEFSADHYHTIDPLTRLANRRGFEILAGHSLAICQRQGIRATLLHMDIDRFGVFNEQIGFDEANQLLQLVAAEIAHVFRESDAVGRVGPDEFAVLLTDTSPDMVGLVSSRLAAALYGAMKERKDGLNLAFSVASVEYDVGRHQSIPVLLAEAETSLHERAEY